MKGQKMIIVKHFRSTGEWVWTPRTTERETVIPGSTPGEERLQGEERLHGRNAVSLPLL